MSTRWQFEALGTQWIIETPESIDKKVKLAVWQRIDEFDRTWSRFRADSAVNALRTGESVDLGPDAEELLGIYDEFYGTTAGAVNPLVGVSMEQLGYDADFSFEAKGDPIPAPSWADCSLEGSILHTPAPIVLDVGAVGKGFLAGKVAELIDSPCVVDASGDIVNRSGGLLKVAMEDPRDADSAIAVTEIPDGWSLAGSATNRRTWGKGLHHVVDARTGVPAESIVAAWGAAPYAGVADGLATAAFFTDLETLGRFEGWTLTLDQKFWADSFDFPGEIFN